MQFLFYFTADASEMTCEGERTRLVVLGGAGVGKSAIVNKFLYNTFSEKYRTTVEDLHSRTFQLGQISIKVCMRLNCRNNIACFKNIILNEIPLKPVINLDSL